MKKIAKLFLSLGLVLSLTACGASGENDAEQPSQTENSNVSEHTLEPSEDLTENTTETSSEVPEESEGGKTLVVYYSATNNTETVAGYIAAATDGDLFEIVPTNP
ncbi:MAG: hypothetical protein NC393_00860 [Clostridium sp.]|nr:hypothetical protein [Clostridium sp.]MCM1209224.1 hypothetical protein [Ruminococcus sp.]